MTVLVLAFLRRFGLCDELLSVSRELSLQQVDAVRSRYVDVYVDGSCFHNSLCLEFHGAKIVQIERNSKGKLVFLCICFTSLHKAAETPSTDVSAENLPVLYGLTASDRNAVAAQ